MPRPRRLSADKAHDASVPRRWLKRRRINAVIPFPASRAFPFALDRKAYKRRNVIGPLWNRLNSWHCAATRTDHHARNCLAGLARCLP